MEQKGSTKRLSDVSGLSEGSSGYEADTSSIGTGSSSSSKRDRLSIMPETFIEPHKVLSPLPKQLPALQMLVKTKDVTKRLSDVSSLSAGSSGYQADASLKTKELTKRLSDVSSLSASSSIGTGSSSSSDRISIMPETLIKPHKVLPPFKLDLDLTRRLSDVSSLSSGSSGYRANTSSIGTGSSSSSKRDRLSIMPETFIEPHKVLSPLPKQLPAVQIDVFEDGYEKTVKEELGVEKSWQSANVSLDNIVTGKRRSKPVKPVKKLTKRRAKKGGEHVETSTQSESEIENENTSDEQRRRIARKSEGGQL